MYSHVHLETIIKNLLKVWSQKDFQLIKAGVQENYPYGHYFESGLIGSGCCIFSRHPILSTFYHRFTLNGYPHEFYRGDWFGGKLVGVALIDYCGIKINVYTTHVSHTK